MHWISSTKHSGFSFFQEREGLDPGLIQLFNVDYETHIFAALSAQSASFPFVLNEIEGIVRVLDVSKPLI